MQLLLVAEERLGGPAHGREAREVELQEDGRAPRRGLQIGDRPLGLVPAARREVDRRVVFEEGLSARRAQCARAAWS